MPELLLATNNKGKLEELGELLTGLPYTLISPAQAGLTLVVAETGRTYTANARLKAVAFARVSGRLTLADDSGLEVDALGGAPGVLSARYAGPEATDAQRVAFLLTRLEGTPPEARSAHFRCVIALASPTGAVRLCSGSCRGLITLSPRGGNGFGYDPVFLFSKLGKTMAELPPEVKNRMSHRARAVRGVREILRQLTE
jgi:XTP/dITP diphosphohydrolase